MCIIYFSEANRSVLVQSGALPILVDVLHSSDTDTQFYSCAALSNLAIHHSHRVMMTAIGYNDLIVRLIRLIEEGEGKASI